MHRILHRSPLTSRFGSMFYGALELNGVFISRNAAHPPPFHLAADGTVTHLEAGGPVLGPLSEASYERGFVIMKPGDMLVFYTDGIVETRGGQRDTPREPSPSEERLASTIPELPENPRLPKLAQLLHPPAVQLEEYGLERLLAVARKHQGRPSQAGVEAIFADRGEGGLAAPAGDDRTPVVGSSPAARRSIPAAFPRPSRLI